LSLLLFMFSQKFVVKFSRKFTQTAESEKCEVQALQFRRSDVDLNPIYSGITNNMFNTII